MASTKRCYPHVSLLVDLAPREAAALFDLMLLDPALAGQLTPAGALDRAEPLRYGYLRALPVTVHRPLRHGGPVAGTLELLPWSESRSELALGARPAHHFPVHNTDSYCAAAHRCLETLAGLLNSRREFGESGYPGPGPDFGAPGSAPPMVVPGARDHGPTHRAAAR